MTNKLPALVATDDEALLQLLMALLGPIGLSVKGVSLKLMKRLPVHSYALIIIDGNVPVEFMPHSGAMVVIDPSDDIESYDHGADLVMHKPLAANVLLARVRSVLRRYGEVL